MTRVSGWTLPALLALSLAFLHPALAQDPSTGSAQAYPAKPIRIILGPGPDIVARIFGQNKGFFGSRLLRFRAVHPRRASVNGLLAPVDTPRTVVSRINAEPQRALQQPDVLQRLKGSAYDPAAANTPEQFAEYIKLEIAKWTKLVKETGMKVD